MSSIDCVTTDDDTEWPIDISLLSLEVHGDQIKNLFARYKSLQKHIISGHEEFMQSVRDYPESLHIRFIMLDCVEDVSSVMISHLLQKYDGCFFHCLPLNEKLISANDGSSYEFHGQKIVPIPPHCANPAALEALLRDSMNMTVQHSTMSLNFGLKPAYSIPLEVLMEATKQEREALIKVILELDFQDASDFSSIRNSFKNDSWLMRVIWEAELSCLPGYDGKILVRFLNNIHRSSSIIMDDSLELFYNLTVFTNGPTQQNIGHFFSLPLNLSKLLIKTSALLIKNVPHYKTENLRLIVKKIGIALNIDLDPNHIVSAVRKFNDYQKPGCPPYIFVMFRYQNLRDAFLFKYLNYEKKLLACDVGIMNGNSEIYVDECLSALTLQKILKAVIQKKKHPKDEEIKVFSYHGQIFIRHNKKEAQINNSRDCQKFLDDL